MPIRIRDRSTTETLTCPRSSGSGAPVTTRVTPAPLSFADQLTTAHMSLVHGDLDRMYVDVEEKGREFLENPTPEELAKYKQQVRDFLAYVVKHALKLKSSISSRELHQIVEKVDEELLSLADALLARERPLLDLAAKVEQINGILLDLKA